MSDAITQIRRNTMNFDRSIRGTQRADYEQFSDFLGLGKRAPKKEEISQNTDTPLCNYSKSLAMVYPEKQEWCGIYDPNVALINGTIFESLNKPFYPTQCAKNNTEGCL